MIRHKTVTRRKIIAVCVAMLLAAVASAAPGTVRDKQRAEPGGDLLFARHCRACHGSGPDKPGTVALAIRSAGTMPAELARRTDLASEMVKAVVRGGMMNMPPFRKTEISDTELDRLAGWLSRPRGPSRKPR